MIDPVSDTLYFKMKWLEDDLLLKKKTLTKNSIKTKQTRQKIAHKNKHILLVHLLIFMFVT